MELVFGHPGFWFILFLAMIAGWVIYGIVLFIRSRRRRRPDAPYRRYEYKPIWPSVTATMITIAVAVCGFVSTVWVHDTTPHTHYARVVAPETVAVDGSHYVELRGFRSAWTCQPADRCGDLVLGEWAEYTSYFGPDGNLIAYDLRPYVAEND